MNNEPSIDACEAEAFARKHPGWACRAELWLALNPPPAVWTGSPLEWAFLEMPSLPSWFS